MDSQWTHNHNGLTKDSHRTYTKIVEKVLVLLGYPRKRMILQWFYKGCPQNRLFPTVGMVVVRVSSVTSRPPSFLPLLPLLSSAPHPYGLVQMQYSWPSL